VHVTAVTVASIRAGGSALVKAGATMSGEGS
jgi:hypothetical protein